MKKLIRGFFGLFNLEVKRSRKKSPAHFYNEQMVKGLGRFKSLKLEINSIVDVGAAAGNWSLSAKALWPESSYLLFEPLEERKKELENLAKIHSNFHFVPLAAGKEKGLIKFVVTDDLDGSGVATGGQGTSNIRSVEVSSIGEEVNKLHLKGPYLIKLDTHGFEVPILEGCTSLLDQTSLFIIESYGFQIADSSLLFWEMCEYMDKLGFRLFDIVDIMHRPKDSAFWQCDAFFIRKENELFKDNKYL